MGELFTSCVLGRFVVGHAHDERSKHEPANFGLTQ